MVRVVAFLAFSGLSLVQVSTQRATGGDAAPSARDMRPGQSATQLSDGRWLLSGGLLDDQPSDAMAIFDPSTLRTSPLPTRLEHGRAGHTATVLADGTVLFVGGVGTEARLLDEVERFDPRTGEVSSVPDLHVTGRTQHSATLLSSGDLLIAGGKDASGRSVNDAEIVDPATGALVGTALFEGKGRAGHRAQLLADGRVVIGEGAGPDGQAAPAMEVFEPSTGTFASIRELRPLPTDSSIPSDGSEDVDRGARVALRFARPVSSQRLSGESFVLEDASGAHVPISTVVAEGGRLVLVRPVSPLRAGQAYHLTAAQLFDRSGDRLADQSVRFVTRPEEQSGVGSSDDDSDQGGVDSVWRALKPLSAAPGVTALAGQVLRLNGAPLADVTIKIEEHETRTDKTGRFLLEGVDAGHEEMIIDGRSANKPNTTYGVFEVGVDIAAGRTTALPYTSWMPKIDTQHAITIASPTTDETVLGNPAIPGLEVHLAAGTVIRDIDGNVAREISITPIPLDRPPFPLPRNVYVPIYFTVQPGGGYVYAADGVTPSGARLFYPNYHQEATGKVFDFWHYDPERLGWHVYGQGQVSAERKQIIPGPGVRVYEFTGAMVASSGFAPPEGPAPCNATGGDPVDLATGLFTFKKQDLMAPDYLPLDLTRFYRTGDYASRAFGVGASQTYDMYIVGDRFPYTYADIVLSSGYRVHFTRTSAGTGFIDAVYEHTATPCAFYKAKISWNQNGWNLKLVDGTTFVFPNSDTATRAEEAAITAIVDRFGNRVDITRATTNTYGNLVGNIVKITGTGGARFDFTYDPSNRITQVKDNIGRTVGYQYDGTGRLWKVTDETGHVTEYSYDAAGRMRTVKDARGIVYLTNSYDSNGRVSQQVMGDGGTYQFAYTLNAGKVTQTDVTDPRGVVRRVTFNAAGYWVGEMRAVGRPEQQVESLERDASTSFTTAVVDALNRRTAFQYTPTGQVSSVTRLAGTPDAVTTTIGYDPTYAQLASVTDPLNHTRLINRGWTAALDSVVDATGRQVTFSVNTRGLVLSATDAAGTTSFDYSETMLTSVTDATGNVARRAVDSGGRTLLVTNALGQSRAIEWSALGKPLRYLDSLGGSTAFGYDENGNIQTVTDAKLGATSYTYDAMDRLAARTDAMGQIQRHSYDLSGNLVQVVDRRGRIVNYSYDGLNRLTGISDDDSNSTTFTYDAGNRVTQIVDSASGTSTLTWDGLDRLFSETSLAGSVSYTYDAAGRRLSTTVQGQSPISYGYDDADRLTSVTQGTTSVTLVYDGAGRRSHAAFSNGVGVDYGYDAAGRMTALSYSYGTASLGNLTYAYDATGQRTSMGGSLARAELPAAVASTGYNAANQLTQWNGQAVVNDLNGSVKALGGQAFEWDSRGRLAAVGGSGASTYTYDGIGRRVGATTATRSVSLLHDGTSVIQESEQGIPQANILSTGLGDETLIRTTSLGARTLLADALGSTVGLVTDAGILATQYSYQPFGAAVRTGEASDNASSFTGRDADATGLYYYRARYYDPSRQRFLSEDPVGFQAGDLNLFAYVFNEPTAFVDPTGTQGLPGAAIGGVWGAVSGWMGAKAAGSSNAAAAVAATVGGVGGAVMGGTGDYVGLPETLWLGARTGMMVDLISQLMNNGGRLDCVNVSSVIGSGLGGAVSASFGRSLSGLFAPLGRNVSTAVGAVGGAGFGFPFPAVMGAAENSLRRKGS
jgi:RHS repeat-associated protein